MNLLKDMSLFRFLKNELTRDYWLENDQEKFTERRKRVYSFMKIPRELEKFLNFGLLQCFDALLFIFTFLPIRFFKSIFKLLYNVFTNGRVISTDGSRLLNSAEICDILKVSILISSFCFLHHVDFSMLYHVIRGQTVIKLYLFFNILDVADRLCSSFGQDILDSLFWTATGSRRRDHVGVIPHLVLAILYVFLHTFIVLLQANTLNVAFNSHNKALLTIMISNNFLELKGSVFKRFEKANLFQMTCSDVRERCHLTILLSIVVIRNLNQFSWDLDHFWVLFPDIMLVFVCELMVDWIKHAFITKFNEISFDVYREYSLSLAYDFVFSRNSKAVSDHLDVVSRRMGFIPLPLAALLSRVVFQTVSFKSLLHVINCFTFLLCLMCTKIFLSILLLGYSQLLVMEKRNSLVITPVIQFVTSKDDLNIPKEQTEEKKEGFRRSQSLGQFDKKDPKNEKEYEIILEYSSSSEESIEQRIKDEKEREKNVTRDQKEAMKATKSHSLDENHSKGIIKLSKVSMSSMSSLEKSDRLSRCVDGATIRVDAAINERINEGVNAVVNDDGNDETGSGVDVECDVSVFDVTDGSDRMNDENATKKDIKADENMLSVENGCRIDSQIVESVLEVESKDTYKESSGAL